MMEPHCLRLIGHRFRLVIMNSMNKTNDYPGGLHQFLYELGVHLTKNQNRVGVVKDASFGEPFKHYHCVINTRDHRPPHFHVCENNVQIAKYSLITGEPIKSPSARLDKMVKKWLAVGNRLEEGRELWARFHGGVTA